MRLLLVEDNQTLRALTCAALSKAGFDADALGTAAEAEAALDVIEYAAMILDLGLPDDDGLTLLRRLRSAGHTLPILMLTARGGVRDRVIGLDSGADDYLVKPFAAEELLARIRGLLRRPKGLLENALGMGALRLDVQAREVTVAGRVEALPPREIAVLEILLRRPGHVIAKKLVEDHLFGFSGEGGANAVEVYVHRLRRFLDGSGAGLRIHTVRGVGYMIVASAS